MAKRFLMIVLALLSSLGGMAAYAADRHLEYGRWEMGLTFGEIPIMAKSFKPGFTVGYLLNEKVRVRLVVQSEDHLQRDGSSFNAQNTGLDGLLRSKERTGMRFFFGVDYRLASWSPYLSAGVVVNGTDIERMLFDNRQRQIGDGSYNSAMKIVQTRRSGWGPALGIGYDIKLNDRLDLNAGIAMALLGDTPIPDIEIVGESILSGDKKVLRNQILDKYKTNSHNNYHIFNLGLSYRFGRDK
ncbi:porin family protein [bacterium]|nr:porin family protein [bacterium]